MDKKTSPYFKLMIDHIDQSWFKVKDMHYPFSGRDFRDLKGFARSFQEWGIMALFDVFMASKSDWVVKSGYSIGAFVKCLPWLVDDLGWKSKAETYRKKIEIPLPPEFKDLFSDVLKQKV